MVVGPSADLKLPIFVTALFSSVPRIDLLQNALTKDFLSMLAWLSFDGFDFSEVISLFDVSVCDTHWVFCKGKGAWVSAVCPWEIGVRNLQALHTWGVSWGIDLATLPGLPDKAQIVPSHCPV